MCRRCIAKIDAKRGWASARGVLLGGRSHVPQRLLRGLKGCTVRRQDRLGLLPLREARQHGPASCAGPARKRAAGVEIVTIQRDAPRLHPPVERHPHRRCSILRAQA